MIFELSGGKLFLLTPNVQRNLFNKFTMRDVKLFWYGDTLDVKRLEILLMDNQNNSWETASDFSSDKNVPEHTKLVWLENQFDRLMHVQCKIEADSMQKESARYNHRKKNMNHDNRSTGVEKE